MDRLFNTILYMSMMSSIVALVIIGIRLLIGSKFPKVLSYSLWGILLCRLLIPVSFSSEVSLFNFYPVVVQNFSSSEEQVGVEDNLDIQVGAIEHNITEDVAFDLSFEYLSYIWIIVALGLITYCVITYRLTLRKLDEAILCKKKLKITGSLGQLMERRKIKIYSLEGLYSPIVCGLLNPKIIVPSQLLEANKEQNLEMVIMHELIHIKRFDNIIKWIALVTACIHWFNPIIWLALILSHKDMERSCDEGVIYLAKQDIRKAYAQALISFSLEGNSLKNATVVAFGESDMKSRIKGILNYRRPKFWMAILGVLIVIFTAVFVGDVSQDTMTVNLEEVKNAYGEEWVTLDEIPDVVINAVIASEDKNFWKHNGIDIGRIASAAFANLKNGEISEGASTITQQVVKNVAFIDMPQSFSRKKIEIYSAIKLEKNYDKETILEAYLNIIQMGHGNIGIGQGAAYYYHKKPSELTLEEAASLVAIIMAPTKYNPIKNKQNNTERTQEIIETMRKLKLI